MRIRTITKAIEELKAEDPHCALTKYGLTKLVKSGEIPSIHQDRVYFIDLDLLKTKLEKGVC